jgi:competence protein ComEC
VTARADAVPTRPPDLRLVPAAGAAWAVVLVGLHTGPVGGVVGAALAGGLLLGGLLSRRAMLVAAGGCALAAALVVTAHAVMVRDHPVRTAAERGAAATLHVVVGDDPRELRSSGVARPGATQVLVPAVLRAAQTAGGRWTGGGRVLLIAPAEGWSELLPGQPVTAEGLLAPATRSDLVGILAAVPCSTGRIAQGARGVAGRSMLTGTVLDRSWQSESQSSGWARAA